MKIHFRYIRFNALVYLIKQIPFYLLLFILSFVIVTQLPAEAVSGSLAQALEDLKSGSYHEARTVFHDLIERDHVLKDYLLFWRAETLLPLGEHARAMEDIESLLSAYPDSPLVQDAAKKRIEIQKAWKPDKVEELLSLLEAYTSRYPQDLPSRYDFARLLIEHGEVERAIKVLVSLYREGFDFPDEGLMAFAGDHLVLEDIIERGNILLREWRFRPAEDLFRFALGKAPEQRKEEIREKVALCVFRQKRYSVSARLYADLNDRYMEAVSYLRAGNDGKFAEALESLRSMKDPRAGALLIAHAAEMRNEGKNDEALALYRNVLKEYPFQEDARWGIAWTEYLAGNYDTASRVLADMYERYNSDRYYYWMLRSEEKKSSAPLVGSYSSLCSRDGYYGLLGCLRAGLGVRRVSVIQDDQSTVDPDLFRRYEMLRELGMKKEALRELKILIKGLAGREDILLFSRKLKDIGEYKSSISVATRLPYHEKLHNLIYPVAYWDVIEKVAGRFNIDPLFILSVAREESRLDPEARSIAGAVGLMQLMPDTATMVSRSLKRPVSAEDEFYDVETNIVLGSYYLKMLVDRFGSIIPAIAAYNAGGNAVQRWLTTIPSSSSDEFVEEIPYPETRNYVKKVLATLHQYKRANGGGGLDKKILLNKGRAARRISDS